jgi:hypothetical protein
MKLTAWSPILRVPAFIILLIVGYALSYLLPILSTKSNLALVTQVFSEVSRGNLKNVSSAQFAYALACSIVSGASGLALAMLVTNVVAIRTSLRYSRRQLTRFRSPNEVKDNFDRINQDLQRDNLIGHAWTEFEKTCLREAMIRRTVRPQTFFNVGLARERLFGMKLMPTIPGYFVGLGLLLTFIGLVIALSKAAEGASGSPENMTQSLRELLDAATFKFSTSIAGLFSSLALALIFKVYTILIETGFEQFCREVEKRTIYLAPQAIMLQTVQAEREQLEQLKQINDAQFFDRLGQTIGPALMSAVDQAVKPLASQLSVTVDKLESASRTGAEGLISRFTDAVQGSAGVELRELSVALGQTKDALNTVQSHLSGTGEDFARRIAEATENFARLVAETGTQFRSANQSGRETIEALLSALTEAADSAKERMQQEVARAGSTASAALGEALSRVAGHMRGFQDTISEFQQNIGREAAVAASHSREAVEAATAAAGRAATETAEAIRSGFAETVAQLRSDIEGMSTALRSSEAAFSDQNRASRSTVAQTELVATAFGKVANDVSSASRPLLQASDRIAVSTEAMARTLNAATESLLQGQAAARTLAERLEEHSRQTETAWRNYEARFGDVDESLSKAVASLASKTAEQQENIANFVLQIDKGCGDAVQKLQAIVGSLDQNTSDLNDSFVEFLEKIPRAAAVSVSG